MDTLILAVSLAFVLGIACGIILARSPKKHGWAGGGRYIPPEIRQWVIEVSRYTCIYCGRVGAEEDPDGFAWEIDHAVPLANGGAHAVSNFALSCRSCNRRKSAGLLPLPFLRRRHRELPASDKRVARKG
jgi:5-methylcytosine-specific restriction endonuclease McrA